MIAATGDAYPHFPARREEGSALRFITLGVRPTT
jgi:hypothetical protein